jgi:hypothetical protein
MQGSDVSPKPVSFLPFWVRIGMACLMFAVTVVPMWDGFLRFDWVFFFCFGLYYVLHLPRQKWGCFRGIHQEATSSRFVGCVDCGNGRGRT